MRSTFTYRQAERSRKRQQLLDTVEAFAEELIDIGQRIQALQEDIASVDAEEMIDQINEGSAGDLPKIQYNHP